MLEQLRDILEDVPVEVDPVSLPLAGARFVEVYRPRRGVSARKLLVYVYDGVVNDRTEGAVLDKDRMVVVVEQVPHDGNIGGFTVFRAGGYRVRLALSGF